ncbi:MAG TPA: DNA replication/repair protein RecF [candidate division Zixibacteria bacterium]|nr:DNA replication/repair protein RecF [candidate division Zixibacteria bacterium]
MRLTHLKASNFRNFSQVELNPTPGVNIFFGLNGSGKTNLLEAVFLLCLGRSQRGVGDNVLLQSGQETYRVEGKLESRGKVQEVSVACSNRGRKQIMIDGIKSRLPELYDNFSAVAIGPEDSELLSGPPSARRLFLDLYISQFSKMYLEQLSRYNRILAQKNAALKDGMEFESYNALLAKSGAEIMKARRQFLEDVLELSENYYKKFSGSSSFDIRYQPSALDSGWPDEKLVESAFEKRLYEVSEKEKIVKMSLIGPHRDEIEMSINALPARTHGSQGEWRSAAIAIKLAAFELLKVKKKFAPLLLLDEVFAELDEKRSAALIDSFEDFEQIFLTTAAEPPELLSRNGKKFQIQNGRIILES